MVLPSQTYQTSTYVGHSMVRILGLACKQNQLWLNLINIPGFVQHHQIHVDQLISHIPQLSISHTFP